jgi:hypothetical protein
MVRPIGRTNQAECVLQQAPRLIRQGCIRMITCMRTTLVLDDELWKQARRRATERDVTVSDVVNDALRESFRRRPVGAKPFSMMTYGSPGRHSRHEPSDFAAILDQEDRDRLR